MCSIIFSCLAISIFIFIGYVFYLYFGWIFSWSFSWGIYLGLRGGALFLIGLIYYCILINLHWVGIDVLKTKLESKTVYKGEKLMENLFLTIMRIFVNIILLVISVIIAINFDSLYIKGPSVVYMCSILGYVACYPLSDVKSLQLVNGGYSKRIVEEEILIKLICNTLCLVGTYASCSYYFF